MLAMFSFYGGGSLLVLRVFLGAVFVVHGWPKIKNLKATAKGFAGMGFKPGWLFGTIAALLEFFGGIGLVIGFLVVPFAAFLALQFLTITIWKILKKAPFTGAGGWELDLVILGGLIALLALGSGSFALDRMFFGPWL